MTMSSEAAKSVRSGANSLLTDLGPIAVFVIAFNVLQRIEATKDNAVYIATGLFIAATLAAIAYHRSRSGRVPPVLIVTGVLVVIFGGLTLLLRDETFIQIKPTVVNGFYVVAILGALAFRQNIWKLLFGHAFRLPDRIWNILALRWAGFFAFMALLNEYIRLNYSFEFWLNTRPLVVFPLVLLFALINTPIALKHTITDEAEPASPTPSA
jgi:intracellular septation protein